MVKEHKERIERARKKRPVALVSPKVAEMLNTYHFDTEELLKNWFRQNRKKWAMFTFYDKDLQILATSRDANDLLLFLDVSSIVLYEKACGKVMVLKAVDKI